MNTRRIVAVLILCFSSYLFVACSSDDDPTGPDNDSNGGSDPTVTTVSPPGAGPGVEAKIIGTNFGASKRAGSVQIAGADAAIQSWSDTEIEIIVPVGVSSDVMASVVVTTSSGKTASSQIDITPPNTYRVTTDIAMDHYPCWSAGATWIYFCSTRAGGTNWEIYRIPAAGGEAERLTNYDGPDFYPDVKVSTGEVAWSSTQDHLGHNPDGDYEIFSGFLSGTQITMGIRTENESRDLDPAWPYSVHAGYTMASTWEQVDHDGSFVAWRVMLHGLGGAEELTEGRQPNFSGNGRWVVYNHDDNIYKMETVGGVPEQLTDTGHDWYPHWGQANDKIVFQRYDSTGGGEDIYVMNSDGTDVQELVGTANGEYCPSWSPDCTKIVYHAHRWSNFDIYVYVVP